jgi:hypothetical protein
MSFADGATSWQRYDVEQRAIAEHEATLAAAHGSIDVPEVFTPEAKRALEAGLANHYRQRFEFGVQVRRVGGARQEAPFLGFPPRIERTTPIGSAALPFDFQSAASKNWKGQP